MPGLPGGSPAGLSECRADVVSPHLVAWGRPLPLSRVCPVNKGNTHHLGGFTAKDPGAHTLMNCTVTAGC